MIRRTLVFILGTICLSACMGEKLTNAELIKEIESIIKQADSSIEKKDWPSANKIIQRGLSTLDLRYYSQEVHDDTGEGLVLAKYLEEKQGKPQEAVNIRYRMLVDRLNQFKSKIGWTEDKPGK